MQRKGLRDERFGGQVREREREMGTAGYAPARRRGTKSYF